MSRLEHRFPTRSYPYRQALVREPLAVGMEANSSSEESSVDAVPQLVADQVYRFVLGLDNEPKPLEPTDVEQLLRDPFAELLLKRGTFPLSLRDLLAAFDTWNDKPEGLPQQDSFFIADGGQVPWSLQTAALNRQFRFAVARSRANNMDVLISASTDIDSQTNFLQLLAWDDANQVFNYYERRAGTWTWAGNSHHALGPATRGRGPFDSHVNGSLVMKELKAPWTHWHSSRAKIQDTALEENDPLRNEPLFRHKTEANLLEINVVKPGITRWNRARLARSLNRDGTLFDVPYLMRQVLDTTTINLISADIESSQVQDDMSFQLPSTFFLNADALLGEIGLQPDISPIRVSGQFYRGSLRRYDFALVDGNFRQVGDTFFAFLVPEPAFEDIDVLSTLLERNIITPHFAASLLMIDFPNPIFSVRRQQLMKYVPQQAHVTEQARVTEQRA
jgi:hypothetical protein